MTHNPEPLKRIEVESEIVIELFKKLGKLWMSNKSYLYNKLNDTIVF